MVNKHQSSMSMVNVSQVKLATLVMVFLLLGCAIPATSALLPSGGEMSPSDVLHCGSRFTGKDGRRKHETPVVSGNRRFLKSGKLPPSPPSPIGNKWRGMFVPPTPPPSSNSK